MRKNREEEQRKTSVSFLIKKLYDIKRKYQGPLSKGDASHQSVIKQLNSKPYSNAVGTKHLCAEKLWNKNPSSAVFSSKVQKYLFHL